MNRLSARFRKYRQYRLIDASQQNDGQRVDVGTQADLDLDVQFVEDQQQREEEARITLNPV